MDADLTPAELTAITRQDFGVFIERAFHAVQPGIPFLPNWHLERIANALEAVRSGESRRLIVNVPPRSLKSHCASVAFPAWLLGHDPKCQLLCVSYAQDLADKLARDCRTLMTSKMYMRAFPHTRLTGARQAVAEFTTPAGGFRMATSVGGTLTGRGADVIIIDDPLKPQDSSSDAQRTAVNEWYAHTLLSRLNNKHSGAIVLIMQRLHEDDLTGFLLREGGWTLLSLPAIAEQDEVHEIRDFVGNYTVRRAAGEALHPERESLEVLNALKHGLGEYHFAGQYQQSPAPLGGGLIKLHWFGRYQSPPATFERIVQSWDTASKAGELNDFSVCTTWGQTGPNIYLLHVLRRRLEFPDLKRAALDQARLYRPNRILIEDKGSGTQLAQELKAQGIHAATPVKVEGDKVMRMMNQTAVIENGHVHIPDQVPWLGDFLAELACFPKGRYDDQVDSVSQALAWIAAQSLEPDGIFQYYKQLSEEQERRQQIVRLRPTPGVNTLIGRDGRQYSFTQDGYFLVPRHALGQLPIGWAIVEE